MNIIRNNFQNSCSNIAIVEVSEKSSPANIVIRKYCSRAPRSNKGRPLKPSVNILHSVSALLSNITIACRSIIWSFVHTWKCYASIALKVKHTNENNSCKKPLLLFSLLFHCLFFAAIAILENVLWKWSRKQNREIENIRTYLNGQCIYISVLRLVSIVIVILCNFYMDILWLWRENVTQTN